MSAESGFGTPRRHFRSTDSTNAQARRLVDAGAPSGTIVTAAQQTAGRGRHGRHWTAPADSALLCSAILAPLGSQHALLPLAAPLAICEAAEALAPVSCQVKWPNDVWLGGRKLAGVLIEARPPDWAIIGIGLNLSIDDDEFEPDLRWPATSLGHRVDAERALAELCAALDRWVAAPESRVQDAFAVRDALAGREVSWQSGTGGAGIARGIDARGNLVVERASGERLAIGAGEVSLRVEV